MGSRAAAGGARRSKRRSSPTAVTSTRTRSCVTKSSRPQPTSRQRLGELGIEYRVIAGTGVVGLVQGTQPGKTVLLRADMDALPITERGESPYRSQERGRHARLRPRRPHSMLLAAARLLQERRDGLRGNVKLMFQPAEEGGGRGGALPMIEEGLMQSPRRRWRLRLARRLRRRQRPHRLPRRAVLRRRGPLRDYGAGQGRPRGASRTRRLTRWLSPRRSSRRCRPSSAASCSPTDVGVVTIGMIKGGEADNVISDTATINGTIRSYTAASREMMHAPPRRNRLRCGRRDAWHGRRQHHARLPGGGQRCRRHGAGTRRRGRHHRP